MKDFKVLLVDDERDFVQALSERLEMRNLDTTLAFDGEEALESLRDDEPDVILLDLKLPGIGGMEILRQVKKVFPRVQVVMLTGHGSTRDEEQARRLGAYAYLGKPVELDRLSQILRAAFESKVPANSEDGATAA